MKESTFVIDKKFVMLHIKILIQQNKFKDAATFIMNNPDYFTDKLEKQHLEAYLFMESTNYILTINTYFSMIRLNSNIKQYSDMAGEYRDIIRIICDDYLPKQKKYEMKADIEE